MKILKLMLVVAVMLFVMPQAMAVTIDGDPSDWGPAGFLTGDWSVNGTWVPNDGVQFIVEDNNNPKAGGSYTGVHIQGTGSNYFFYDEPQVKTKWGNLVWEPYNSEDWDLEAMYFQQDDDFVYLLIVTSLPPDGDGNYAPGDLRIDVNKLENSDDGYKWEFGVKLGTRTGLTQFGIYDVGDWSESPDYIPENIPTLIVNGKLVGQATGSYVKCTACNLGTGQDYGVDIYIIELSIPKPALGLSSGTKVNFSDFSVVDGCTNDEVSIPEFLTILIPVGIVAGLVYYRIKRE